MREPHRTGAPRDPRDPAVRRRWRAAAALALAGALVDACGSSDDAPVGTNDAGTDGAADVSASDASADATAEADAKGAAPDDRFATGRRLVPRTATLEGLTTDGFVAFSEPSASGGRAAKVIALDGTGETSITEGTGSDKAVLIQALGRDVFVWTNRGNRTATLTVWSKATGVLSKGTGIRPGRAAATPDGAFIGFIQNVTAASADIVVGPIDGSQATVIGTLNATDDTCWRNVDLGFVGAAAPRFVSRYCPGTATAFVLRSTTPAGGGSVDLSTSATDATFGKEIVALREASGTLKTSAPDGTGAVVIASNATAYALSRDESMVAYQTTDDAILASPARAASPRVVVPAGRAKRLGAIARDNQHLLYASVLGDAGPNALDTPTDVLLAALDGGAPVSLVATPTSCPDCLADSFTLDSSYALVIDPIDDSVDAGGSGPLRAFGLDAGAAMTFGKSVWTTLALDGGGGAASRLLVVEIGRTPALETGYAYTLTTRALSPSDAPVVLARGAERVAVDATRTTTLYSIPGAGDVAGIWIAPLD